MVYHRFPSGAFDTEAYSSLPDWMTAGLGRHVWHTAVWIDLDSEKATDQTLTRMQLLRRLEVLHLSNTSVTSEGLAALSTFPELQFVTLDTDGIDDRALRHLALCPALETLFIHHARFTDAGLCELQRATRLRHLWLEETDVTAEGVRRLQEVLPACKIEVTP